MKPKTTAIVACIGFAMIYVGFVAGPNGDPGLASIWATVILIGLFMIIAAAIVGNLNWPYDLVEMEKRNNETSARVKRAIESLSESERVELGKMIHESDMRFDNVYNEIESTN